MKLGMSQPSIHTWNYGNKEHCRCMTTATDSQHGDVLYLHARSKQCLMFARSKQCLCFLIRMPKFQWASKFLSKQEVWALDNSYKILLCLSKWALVLRIKINMEKKKTIFTIFSIMKFFEHNIAYCKLMN